MRPQRQRSGVSYTWDAVMFIIVKQIPRLRLGHWYYNRTPVSSNVLLPIKFQYFCCHTIDKKQKSALCELNKLAHAGCIFWLVINRYRIRMCASNNV